MSKRNEIHLRRQGCIRWNAARQILCRVSRSSRTTNITYLFHVPGRRCFSRVRIANLTTEAFKTLSELIFLVGFTSSPLRASTSGRTTSCNSVASASQMSLIDPRHLKRETACSFQSSAGKGVDAAVGQQSSSMQICGKNNKPRAQNTQHSGCTLACKERSVTCL